MQWVATYVDKQAMAIIKEERERDLITLMDNNTLTYIHMVALNNEILIVDTLVRVKKELKSQK